MIRPRGSGAVQLQGDAGQAGQGRPVGHDSGSGGADTGRTPRRDDLGATPQAGFRDRHRDLSGLRRGDLVDVLAWLSTPPGPEETGPRPLLHRLYQPLAGYILAVMQVTQVLSVRLAILTLALPAFGLFSLVALVWSRTQKIETKRQARPNAQSFERPS